MNDGARINAFHGAGGEIAGNLLSDLILPRFVDHGLGRIELHALDDGAALDRPDRGEIVFTTDSHVVKPLFFPGGDIGRLAAAGTLNDLAVMGARPLALSLAIIVEEGFPVDKLDRALRSFHDTLVEVGAALVCGDTKVMPHGDLDGLILNSSGIGIADPAISDAAFEAGDIVLVTGTLGDHGMTILLAREQFELQTDLASDVAPVWPLVERALSVGGIRSMKDPTRGGLAAALNEMARKAHAGITVRESAIPIRDEVRGLSEMLGIPALSVANEGKAVLIVSRDHADAVLESLRGHPLGADAAIIGEVTADWPGRVILDTVVGGKRFLDMPLGDPVPRIC
ncbi:hydrogenase expression/formation protein HypE [Candidatus Bipolaricaulota bacterium]|nr:hydrogenase expression/formation protein HypE [Candidatus Bipolaricaulota bacterium]